MTELIDEIANELLMTIGPEAVRDLDLKEWDEAEYESMTYDYEITMAEAKEAFPRALAQAKVEAGLRAPSKGDLFDPMSGRWLRFPI